MLDDAPIAALKTAADLPLGRVYLDPGIEELRGAGRVSLEDVLEAGEIDGSETALRIQAPQSRNASRTTSTFSLAIAAQYPRLVCVPVSWKVTVRHGSNVGREKFRSLDEAIDEARRRVEEIQARGSAAGDQRLSQAHA